MKEEAEIILFVLIKVNKGKGGGSVKVDKKKLLYVHIINFVEVATFILKLKHSFENSIFLCLKFGYCSILHFSVSYEN